ncbi:ComEC/Rec2 family competence protein [Lacticigenium naphthae]|uniref:ComEC/Rec2 family competence protein n=1 Tax=Lacticigenium naphthae TaxID=515351 RepID=UPI00040AF824|nr:ComEC/Rec2 family competence protein [Lacticigenium naphthae]
MAKKRKTKKQKQQRNQLIGFVLTLIFTFLFGLSVGKGNGLSNISKNIEEIKERFSQQFQESTGKEENSDIVSVHFFDVGQGSSSLLQSEDGTTILIDTGRYEDKDKKILQYLDKYIGTGGTIDLLIFSHNDADHIGYGDLILDYYDVKEVWMNGVDSTSQIYGKILDGLLANESIEYLEPKRGEKFKKGPFDITVLNPSNVVSNNQNEASIVTNITVNDTNILFPGDLSTSGEIEIFNSYPSLKSEVVLLGHHGSETSTDEVFLNKINPKIAIYSAGQNNSYNHPSPSVLNLLEKKNIPYYGTDEYGEIILKINSTAEIFIEVENEESE